MWWDAIITDGSISIEITSPTANDTHSAATSPIDVGGSASDTNGAVSSVSWSCSTCTPASGSAAPLDGNYDGASEDWIVHQIGLSAGENVITVSTTDDDNNSGRDRITIMLADPGNSQPANPDNSSNGGNSSNGCFL